MTSVAVLGAGALGSVYGAALARAGCDVTLLARPAHAKPIARDGLRLRTPDGLVDQVRVLATSDQGALPPASILVVSAKAHDVPGLVAAVPWRPEIVFGVQNGVGKDAALEDTFGPCVVGCVSQVGATLAGPGVVHVTAAGYTSLGPLAVTHPGLPDRLAGLLGDGGLKVEVRGDIEAATWSKAVLAVAAMGVIALTRLPVHRMFLNEHAAGVFADLAREAAAIARAEGIEPVDLPGAFEVRSLLDVDRSIAVERLRAVGEALAASGATEFKASILQSIESGRRTEVEAIHGDLLARAVGRGVEVPVLKTVTGVLRAIDAELE